MANGLLPRFPVSRQGYNCVAVDEYVGQLEDELSTLDREMAQLRVQVETNAEVRSEIQRIGAETSAVLIAAHEQREEMLRLAREEADRCVAEARSQANALTAEYETRLRELKAQSDVVRGERERMLDEVRSVSVALAALADSVHEPAIS